MSTSREDMKTAAFVIGQQLADGAGDFYDVVAELVAGYCEGYSVQDASDAHYRTAIGALAELASVSGNVLEGIVAEAREKHVSWSVIGDGLDVSKQAAQQKYGSK